MDDLPAPFGPMMARISPFLMSKLTSASALTPPNRRLMPSTSRRTSSKVRARPARVIGSASVAIAALLFRRLRHRGLREHVADRHLGLDGAGAAVLEGHLGLDRDAVAVR